MLARLLIACCKGYCVVLGSTTRSVPQILRILRNKRWGPLTWASTGTDIVHCKGQEFRAVVKCPSLARSRLLSWLIYVPNSGLARRLKGMLPMFCSADGLSLAAQYSELIAYSITLAYNLRHGALSPHSQHYVCGAKNLRWGRAARLTHAAAHSVECAIADLVSKSARQAVVLCALRLGQCLLD